LAGSDEPASLKEVQEDTKFVEQDPRDEGRKGLVYGEAITREEIIELIKTQVLSVVEGTLGKLLPRKLGEKHRKRALGGTLVKDGKTRKLNRED
jgi:hypothetical protein